MMDRLAMVEEKLQKLLKKIYSRLAALEDKTTRLDAELDALERRMDRMEIGK